MRAIVSRNSHCNEVEHQSNGGPELDPNSSTRDTAVSKNEQVSQYDKLLSKTITEDDYTVPGRKKTQKEKSDPQMPCYDSVKNKKALCSKEASNKTAQSSQYDKLLSKETNEDSYAFLNRTKTPEEKGPVLTPYYSVDHNLSSSEEATKTEQPSQHYDKLLPKETTEASYAVQNQESEKATLMPYYDCVRENYSSSIEVADKTEETYECDKLVSEEFTEYSYAIPYQNKTSKVVAVTPYYDRVEWDYETIEDSVVEKGALASSEDFCQLKQKCNSNFGKTLNEGLQMSAVSQDEIYDVVYI